MKSCVSSLMLGLVLGLSMGLPLGAQAQTGPAAHGLPRTQAPLPSVLDQREIRAQLAPRRYTTCLLYTSPSPRD